mgnify:CR=1 FL=1
MTSCLWYCKDIHLEANHNQYLCRSSSHTVVYDIAKIYIWKQITTNLDGDYTELSCLWYCKDIHLEANHNNILNNCLISLVVYDIAKIYIWKQITTLFLLRCFGCLLFMILQRYTFGSKSQQECLWTLTFYRCLWYCKDIHLEANHNCFFRFEGYALVVYDIAKIYIWKQITTYCNTHFYGRRLFMILQRYTFGSKSQRREAPTPITIVVYDIAKIYIWKQITTLVLTTSSTPLLFMILQRYTFGSKSQLPLTT